MSGYVGTAAAACLVSNAHCCSAPSIWRRLLMHAFFCEVVRALMKLGIAIAARRPMMATTIIISTNVKPDLREVLMFILCLSLYLRRERSDRRVSIITTSVHSLPVANRTSIGSSLDAMLASVGYSHAPRLL